MKIAIYIPTYTTYDFLVGPMITLLDTFWKNHPPVYVIGTNKSFTGAETIIPPNQDLRGWVANYRAGLQILHSRGYTHFYLALDDLHPIAQCNAAYLNDVLPKKAASLNAGYMYLFGFRSTQQVLDCKDEDFLRIAPQTKYSIALQTAFWNTEYALNITRQMIASGITSIWHYETKGSFLRFTDDRPNFVIKNNTQCPAAKSLRKKVRPDHLKNVSLTPYPFLRGGLLYRGRTTTMTRQVYRAALGEHDYIRKMISHTRTPAYLLRDLYKRIRRRIAYMKKTNAFFSHST